MGLPVLIGAGVGGLTSALRGQNILKGAALGGALGGVGSGLSGLMSQGATGAVGAASNAGLGQGISLAPSLADDVALSLSPTTAIGNTGVGINLANAAPSSLLDYGFNPAVQNLSQTPLSLAGGGISLPQSVGTQLAAGNVGRMGTNLSDLASKYGTIDNLTGAAQIASMYQPQPMQAAPSGRIEVGQAPSPAGFAEFMNQYYPQYKQKRPDLGLLG